jgi:Ca2+-binding EF-hand superfamily protein
MRILLPIIAALAILPATAFSGPAPASAATEFRRMDTNKDGKISPEEHAIGAQQMFADMDVNKDGKVTFQEMDGAHGGVEGARANPHALSSAEKIKAIDTDGDGVLTAEEHRIGAAAMFGKMDTGKDGFLSMEEVAAGHRAMLMKKP